MTMLITFIVVGVAVAMMFIESRRPARALPRSKGWWPRALALNGVQAFSVWALGRSLDPWLAPDVGALKDAGPIVGALAGYFVLSFVYYLWHRARHEVPVLWRLFHQTHHSVTRLEVVSSFYKHPFEILANGVLSSFILFVVLGLSAEAASGATLLCGLAELFYHWNVRTPRWLGYFIQRPEMHRVHHKQGAHRSNYADLPLWDMLFGTFDNPERAEDPVGFGAAEEQRLVDMLVGVDVVAKAAKPAAKRPRLMALAIATIGLLGVSGDAFGLPLLEGAGALSGASPAPKVFTQVGESEPFSSRYELHFVDAEGPQRLVLNSERYARIRGPYNRRNVFGAVVAAGPELEANPMLRDMAEQVRRYALCGEAPLLRELGLDPEAVWDVAIVRYERNGVRTRNAARCNP